METRGRDYVTDEQGRVRIKRQLDSALLTRPFVARFHQCSGRPKLTQLIFTSNIEERVVSRVDSRRRSSLTSILLINSPSLERSIERDALATSLPAKTRFNRLNIYRGHPISSTCYRVSRHRYFHFELQFALFANHSFSFVVKFHVALLRRSSPYVRRT